MPQYQVGYLRVTHPCATSALLHPFDLHVLGLPLAFILSQDQTLHCIISQITLLVSSGYLVLLDQLEDLVWLVSTPDS